MRSFYLSSDIEWRMLFAIRHFDTKRLHSARSPLNDALAQARRFRGWWFDLKAKVLVHSGQKVRILCKGFAKSKQALDALGIYDLYK